MTAQKTKFALYFGNRGFFPAALIDSARRDLPRVLKSMGHDSIILDKNATRNGAIEITRETLRSELERLLTNPSDATAMATRAREAILKRQGATKRAIWMLSMRPTGGMHFAARFPLWMSSASAM